MTTTSKRNQAMEGALARWYARQRSSAPQLAVVRDYAERLAAGLPAGAAVLEVAPGPGYLAVELARRGFAVTGLDLSETFMTIASDNARAAGVSVELRLGDAADLPFDSESFDLVVCQAAFKSFGRPERAVTEMHRVLHPGGTAVIHDLNRDATDADIDDEVRGMGLNRLNSVLTRLPLRALRRRAYAGTELECLAAGSPFGTAEVTTDGLTLEARLVKR